MLKYNFNIFRKEKKKEIHQLERGLENMWIHIIRYGVKSAKVSYRYYLKATNKFNQEEKSEISRIMQKA